MEGALILSHLYNFLSVSSHSAAEEIESLSEYMGADAGKSSLSWDYFFNNPEWLDYGSLAAWSLLWGFAVVLVIVMIRAIARNFSTGFRDISLKWCFIVVWIYGFIVYDIGMCTGQYISLLTNAPMAILYAFKIFLFDSDVSEIHEIFHTSWFYSMNFALVHFLAAVISTLFLIKYFGFNIMTRLRMWWASRKFAHKVSNTYVFWGYNDNSINLIESIIKKYKDEKSKDYRIVIVRTSLTEKEDLHERTGVARIFNLLGMPTSELERLQSLGCLTTGTYSNLKKKSVGNKEEDILGKALKLRKLQKLLLRNTNHKIHFLFLSDDEKENLHNASVLLHDSTIKEFVTGADEGMQNEAEREVVLYCLARYNSIHRVIEDQTPSGRIKVRVVDSSHINVELLKMKPNKDLLPVNFVEIEGDATVSSAFNALVVGFSEVGMDSVRFLYEFGAFVSHEGDKGSSARSEFHIDVVDKHMADLAGTFVANAPAIELSMPFIKDGEKPGAMITLHEADCRSIQFYEQLKDRWIEKLNYVVVATDDDELNISLGVRIFKSAARYRKDMEKLCILVRAHNDDDGRISGIAQHYNRQWASYCCGLEEDKNGIHQTKIQTGQEVSGPIHIFGLDSETFTYDNIIADELERQARQYAQTYEETVNPEAEFKVSAWDDRLNKLMQLIEPWKGFSPTYAALMKLRRTEAQDVANSQHEFTKRILVDKALERCKLKDFDFSKLTRKPRTTAYVWPDGQKVVDKIENIAINIAKTEHLRWAASHEILGYVPADAKDEVKLMHDCLKDWSKLTEKERSYDCNLSDYILGVRFSRENK